MCVQRVCGCWPEKVTTTRIEKQKKVIFDAVTYEAFEYFADCYIVSTVGLTKRRYNVSVELHFFWSRLLNLLFFED